MDLIKVNNAYQVKGKDRVTLKGNFISYKVIILFGYGRGIRAGRGGNINEAFNT